MKNDGQNTTFLCETSYNSDIKKDIFGIKNSALSKVHNLNIILPWGNIRQTQNEITFYKINGL